METKTPFTLSPSSGTTITLNSVDYNTTGEIRDVLKSIMPSAYASQDFSAVQALMTLGLATGQIVRISSHKDLGLES